jgi:RNA polymerase sigma factor (sigma-70 family)
MTNSNRPLTVASPQAASIIGAAHPRACPPPADPAGGLAPRRAGPPAPAGIAPPAAAATTSNSSRPEAIVITAHAASATASPGTSAPHPGRKNAPPMRGDVLVTDLVMRARTGDKQAWDALVERYAPVVWAICRRYRLSTADAQDAGQSVWLHLVEQLGNLRDAAVLRGWLATTARRECARVLRAAHHPQAAALVPDVGNIVDEQAEIPEQELLAAERHAVLREALTCLPPRGQQLLTLLTHDPPVPYAQIGATLGIPVGSIGPLRRRYLDKLRHHPAITALINAENWSVP